MACIHTLIFMNTQQTTLPVPADDGNISPGLLHILGVVLLDVLEEVEEAFQRVVVGQGAERRAEDKLNP